MLLNSKEEKEFSKICFFLFKVNLFYNLIEQSKSNKFPLKLNVEHDNIRA